MSIKSILIQRIQLAKNNLLFFWRHNPQNFILALIFVVASGIGLYLAMLGTFNFIITLGGMGTLILKKIIFIMFSVLFFMVGVSFSALFYGLGICGRETEFLFSLPIAKEKIALYKFIESAVLAAWIPLGGIFFFFLAYLQVGGKNLWLAFAALVFSLPFMVISCFLGYLLLLFVVKFFNLKKFVVTLSILLLLGVCLAVASSKNLVSQNDFVFLLSDELFFLRFSKFWFFPFSWPAYCLTYLEDMRLVQVSLYFVNLLVLGCLSISSVFKLQELFIQAYHKRFSAGKRKVSSRDYLEKIVSGIFILPKTSRYFISKDIKLLLRTPSIYLQCLIPFGMLFFYFLNLQKFSYHLLGIVWKNLLTFLNIFGILSIIAAVALRFVFPQWSLEGRNFWVLKLSLVSLGKIFFAKFLLAFGILFIISEALIFTANRMLGIESFLFRLSLGLVGVATFTIVSISLGLGAFFADFKQEYYLKAIESFGGFIALVVTFGYIALSASGFAIILHFYSKELLDNFANFFKIIIMVWLTGSLGVSLFLIFWGLNRLKIKEY